MILKKTGQRENLAIPDHREVDEGMARSLVRQMGLTVDEFLAEARK